MKFLQLLRRYMHGIRGYTFLLGIMLFWAMVCGCVALGEVQYAREDLDLISDAQGKNAYLITYFPTKADLQTSLDKKYAEKLQERLKADDAVSDAYCIRTVNPVSYGGDGISIVLYEPGMLSFFPKLQKKLGLDFSSSPEGCILASDLFGTIREGDEVTLQLAKNQVTLPVAGRLQTPCKYPTLSVSSTRTRASDLFEQGGAVFMQSTDAVMEMLEQESGKVSCSSNLIVVFKDHVDEQTVHALIEELAPAYLVTSFDDIIEDSGENLRKTMIQNIPIPVFLACTAFFSYFSVAVLTFRKKKAELAYLYLCGGSRKKCGWLAFFASQLSALIPTLLVGALVLTWERIPWSQIASGLVLSGTDNRMLWSTAFYLSQLHVDPSCVWVVLLYFCVTVLISLAVTAFALKRHTPLTYLRGVS